MALLPLYLPLPRVFTKELYRALFCVILENFPLDFLGWLLMELGSMLDGINQDLGVLGRCRMVEFQYFTSLVLGSSTFGKKVGPQVSWLWLFLWDSVENSRIFGLWCLGWDRWYLSVRLRVPKIEIPVDFRILWRSWAFWQIVHSFGYKNEIFS